MKSTDLAWMAAILDLKGTILNKNNPKRRKGSRQLVLAVDSIHPPIIRRLSQLTGTKPEFRATTYKEFDRRNCSEHCPEPHIHVFAFKNPGDTYNAGRWTVTGAALDTVLTSVMPYTSMDRGYEYAIDQVRDTVPLEGQGIGAVLKSLRRMHGLGWEIPNFYSSLLYRFAAAEDVIEAEADHALAN